MVPNQGNFQVNNELSLLDVLSKAGGWTEFADLRYIKITRQSTSGSKAYILVADLTAYMETGDPRGLPVVRPGDLVFVPKKENYVREFGSFLQEVFLLFGFFRIFN
jgi:protein involved in polysaccharide export with SLBB domain